MSPFDLSVRLRQGILALAAALALAAPAAGVDNPCSRVTHKGSNYAGQDLRDRNFSSQNLAGANFTNAQLQGAVFSGANLNAADFTGAAMGISSTSKRDTSFSRADLTDACFLGAAVGTTDLQFASLPCAVFDATDISNAVFGPVIRPAAPGGACRTSFRGTVMNCEFIPQWKDLEMAHANVQNCYGMLAGIDFSDARMEEVIFSGLELSKTRWERAQLRRAFFLNSKLREAVFSGADLRTAQLSQADLSGAKLNNQVRLSGSHLSGAVLKGADLTGAVLQGADNLPAADLSLAFMADAVLTDAKMTGVNLSHANFYGESAKADNANMQQTDFSNANLGSVNLTQGLLKGSRMDAANLINAVLISADFTRTPDFISASLVQANLQGAKLASAKLGGANLSNAAVSLADGVVLFKAPASLTADLDRRELSAEVVTAFTSHGYHPIECVDPAVIVDLEGSRWQIWLGRAVGPAGATYSKFALDKKTAAIQVSGLPAGAPPVPLFTVDRAFSTLLDKKLLPSALFATFRDRQYGLPPCSNPAIGVKTPGSRWDLGETLTAITAGGIGYTRFNLITESPDIQVYGKDVTIIRRDENGVLTLVPVQLNATELTADAFDDNTTCPNQKSYGANKQSGATWKEMMTAVSPPPPPPCIPSPLRWCS